MATNNNPFAPAEQVQKHLKVLVYGESGSGKTWFALGFPAPIAVIDTEGGTELYGGRKDLPGFHVLRTKSYDDVMKALDFIEADGGKTYKTVVIDPITVIYQVLQEAASKRSRARDGGIDMRGWGVIKNMMNQLYTRLTNLPAHVVVTARQKDDYNRDGSDLIKVGVKPDSEKSTPYLFDIVVRLEHNNGNGRKAVVEKDRSSTLPETVENLSFKAHLEPIAGHYSNGTAVRHQADEEAAEQVADGMAARDHWINRPEVKLRFGTLCRELKLSDEDVLAALKVKAVQDFRGSMADARERLEIFADARRGDGNGQPDKPENGKPELKLVRPDEKTPKVLSAAQIKRLEKETPGSWHQVAEWLSKEFGIEYTADEVQERLKALHGLSPEKLEKVQYCWSLALAMAQNDAELAVKADELERQTEAEAQDELF